MSSRRAKHWSFNSSHSFYLWRSWRRVFSSTSSFSLNIMTKLRTTREDAISEPFLDRQLFLIWMELLLLKTFIAFFPAFTLFFAFLLLVGFCYLMQDQNFLIRHCYLWLHLIKMMIPILKAVAWLATRDTHACVRENKTQDWKWPVCLLLSLLAWLWPFGPVFGLSDTLYNLTICEIGVICVQPSNCQQFSWTWFTREFAETVRFHRAGRSTLSD